MNTLYPTYTTEFKTDQELKCQRASKFKNTETHEEIQQRRFKFGSTNYRPQTNDLEYIKLEYIKQHGRSASYVSDPTLVMLHLLAGQLTRQARLCRLPIVRAWKEGTKRFRNMSQDWACRMCDVCLSKSLTGIIKLNFALGSKAYCPFSMRGIPGPLEMWVTGTLTTSHFSSASYLLSSGIS